MYRQLEHLVELADLPNVDLRILPLASGGVRLTDSFGVLSYGAPEAGESGTVLADVVWVESVKSQIYVGGETETYNFGLVFNGLQHAALPPMESTRFIRTTAKRMWQSIPKDAPQ